MKMIRHLSSKKTGVTAGKWAAKELTGKVAIKATFTAGGVTLGATIHVMPKFTGG